MTARWCTPLPGGVRLSVQVAPNAKKTEVAGIVDDALKIRLHAQPIEGRANDVLVRYLAHVLDVPRSTVTITHGLSSKRKTVAVVSAGLDAGTVAQRLLAELK
ncbi:DUF167 domain-containing protein [Oxalobacteraceae bacterium OM1]|nr:DUF167 domain-containing protein [Oxalobacteraceae bacterium OM1]